MQERRKTRRMRALKGAKLILGKSSTRDCVVRDVTDAGAGVELPNTLDLPEALDLTFDRGGPPRRARLVWRKLSKTGVKFV
jgi:hypothetical protein